jgi:hypothetical protein
MRLAVWLLVAETQERDTAVAPLTLGLAVLNTDTVVPLMAIVELVVSLLSV